MKKFLSGIIGGLATVLLFSITLGIQLLKNVRAGAEFSCVAALEELYTQGEVITIPQGTFEEDGKQTLADIYVIFPDGAKKKTDGFLLEKTGRYTVIYSAEVNGKIYTEEKIFECCAPKAEVDALAASVEFEEARTFVNYKATDETTQSGYAETTQSGLNVKLTQGATFSYNSIIDVSKYDGTTPLLTCYVSAVKDDYPTFYMLTLRLTDIYDENNYIEILMHKYGGKGLNSKKPVYIRGRVGDQPSMGLNGKELKKDYYGCWTPASWDYVESGGDTAANSIGFYLDYENMQVKNYLGKLASDLSSTDYFTQPWQGFTTGEAYVSLYASEFGDSEGNVFITQIGDDAGAALGEKHLVDKDPPLLSVDFGEYDENMLPVAVLDKAYPIFTANALDFYSGVKSVTANVYYNYDSLDKVNVTLENGAFTPKYEGAYTIEYKALDCAGNCAVRKVSVTAVKEIGAGLTIAMIGEKQTDGYVAIDIPVAGYEVQNASGEYDVSITASAAGKTYVLDKDERILHVKEAGRYAVTYTVTDYVGRTASCSYEVNVVPSDDPVFLSNAIIPKYVLAGVAQRLPALSAYDYKNGGKEVEARISVSAEGIDTQTLEDETLVPSQEFAGKTLTITYTATTATGESTQSYQVECVSILRDPSLYTDPEQNINKNVEKKNLFVASAGVTADYGKITEKDTSEYVTYTFTEAGRLDYVNALIASNFSIQFNILKGNFNILNVYLTDAENATEQVKLSLIKRDEYVGFTINGGIEYKLNTQTFLDPERAFNIGYNWHDACVEMENGNSVFSLTGNGEKPFASGKIYYTFEMLEVTGESTILVQKIRNQTLTRTTRDNANPEGMIWGTYKSNYEVNEEVELLHFKSTDAINPMSLNVFITVQYQNEDGSFEVVNGVDGTKLDMVALDKTYTVKLSKYGSYAVEYVVEGGNTYTYMLNVGDFVAPELKWATELSDTYKVGETVTPNANATGADKDLTVSVMIKNASGTTDWVQLGGSYTFNKAGNYVIYAYAYDGNGNCGMLTKTITVKEA